MTYDTVSFLSDFGLVDESVGVCKSVLLSFAPHVSVVDLTHQVPPHDVRAAALTLMRSEPYMNTGIVLACVGNGRPVAVEVGDGQAMLVGFDNGSLAPLAASVGGASRAVHLGTAGASPTFLARDVLAPATGRLCTGTSITELGTAIDTSALQPSMLPFSEDKDGVLHAEVIWIDSFGNAQLNIEPDQLSALGSLVRASSEESSVSARRVQRFEDLGSTQTGLLDDAHGLVSLVMNQQSAALHHRLVVGTALQLRRAMPVT